VLDFFQPSSTDVHHSSHGSIASNKKRVPKSHLTISGPSELPVFRCVDDFSAADKIELSLKRNARVQVIQKHINGTAVRESATQVTSFLYV
jgi:hypothetical protein